MECEAIKRVRDVFGLKNLKVMVPFCRTPQEGERVMAIMKEAGLQRGQDDLAVYVMCEIPSNILLVEQFLDVFDGMSIGSNDLSQLTLGIDRDNGNLAHIGDERNEAVKELIRRVIKACQARGKYCGICGQAPSDYLEFAQFLVQEGIESMSLNPDTVIKTILSLSAKAN
jgi:pyruvate,water dikinase